MKIWAKPSPKNEKGQLPVDVRRSKTSLLKFPNITQTLGCLGYNHTDLLILLFFSFLEADLKLDGLQSCNFSVM